MPKPRCLAAVSASVFCALIVGSVGAADQFPNKPIRLVTSAPGGGSDFTARLVAQGIAEPLGQPVIIENRGGMSTVTIVASSAPDGYTLSVAGPSIWLGPLLRKDAPEMIKFFTPVSIVTRELLMVAVNPGVPATSVKELIALAKAKPGALNFGSGVVGSTPHLAAALFASMADIKLTHVPYKSSGQAIPALIGGEVQLLITDLGLLQPHVKSGKLRGLAISSLEPSALAAGVPTVSQAGLPGYEAIGITGILAPVKTPPAIVKRLNTEIVRALGRPEIKEKFLSAGSEVVGSTVEEYGVIIKKEIVKWSKVIKEAGIRAD